MIRRRRGRPTVTNNFHLQAIFHEIVSEAEEGNYAEIRMFKRTWTLMWRMCGKPEVTEYDEHESFMFDGRRYIQKTHGKPPSGILDWDSDDDDED